MPAWTCQLITKVTGHWATILSTTDAIQQLQSSRPWFLFKHSSPEVNQMWSASFTSSSPVLHVWSITMASSDLIGWPISHGCFAMTVLKVPCSYGIHVLQCSHNVPMACMFLNVPMYASYAMVAYKIPCSCGKFYIGGTRRRLETNERTSTCLQRTVQKVSHCRTCMGKWPYQLSGRKRPWLTLLKDPRNSWLEAFQIRLTSGEGCFNTDWNFVKVEWYQQGRGLRPSDLWPA